MLFLLPFSAFSLLLFPYVVPLHTSHETKIEMEGLRIEKDMGEERDDLRVKKKKGEGKKKKRKKNQSLKGKRWSSVLLPFFGIS